MCAIPLDKNWLLSSNRIEASNVPLRQPATNAGLSLQHLFAYAVFSERALDVMMSVRIAWFQKDNEGQLLENILHLHKSQAWPLTFGFQMWISVWSGVTKAARQIMTKQHNINCIRLGFVFFVLNFGHWWNLRASPTATKQLRAVQPKYSKVPRVSCSEVKDVIRPIYIIWYVESPSQEILVIVFLEGEECCKMSLQCHKHPRDTASKQAYK
jgi:hypothetical protein